MKKFAVLALGIVLTLPAFGTPLKQGLYEVRTEASYDIKDINTDEDFVSGVGRLGYYFMDNVQLGGLVSFGKSPWESYWNVNDVWGLGGYAEYNMALNKSLVPYVGISAVFFSAEDKDTISTLNAYAGLKFFFTETVGLCAQVNGSLASDDIYDYNREDLPENGNGETFDITANVGLVFLLE